MAISKRARFEVLKRDGHMCRYCGAAAPDVALTVDHVVPVALGGSDAPDNLVAACRDCNAGKSSVSPEAATVAQVSDEALRWGEAVKAAAARMLAEYESVSQRHSWFTDAWERWDHDREYLPNGWAKSIDCWVSAGLPKEILLDCLDLALDNKRVAHRGVFAYMGGIARNRVEDLHKSAKALLEEGGSGGA